MRTLPKPKLLIIEDEPMTGRLLQDAAESYWDVTWVKSGDAALAAVAQQRPDAVSTDNNFPLGFAPDGADEIALNKLGAGLLVTKRLRGMPEMAAVPFVMGTDSGTPEIEAAAKALGILHMVPGKGHASYEDNMLAALDAALTPSPPQNSVQGDKIVRGGGPLPGSQHHDAFRL